MAGSASKFDAFRIHDRRFPALSGVGAALRGGRWNPPGLQVVYASLAYEGTLLETLARVAGAKVPRGHVASRIVLPEGCEVNRLGASEAPDWFDWAASQEIGRAWADSGRSLALDVPSFVARPWGRNVLLNPRHADFCRIRVAAVADIEWDPRLF